jgi:hypothetical protein
LGGGSSWVASRAPRYVATAAAPASTAITAATTIPAVVRPFVAIDQLLPTRSQLACETAKPKTWKMVQANAAPNTPNHCRKTRLRRVPVTATATPA